MKTNVIKRTKLFAGMSTVNKQVVDTKLFDLELIKQDIMNHFMTKKGERVMNPDFGSITWSLLFEPFTDINRQLIIKDAEEIIRSEPRVELISLDAYDSDYGITIEALVTYTPFNVTENLYVNFVRNNFKTSGNIGTDVYSEDLEG